MDPEAGTGPTPGSLSWKLSSHPITLMTFLAFRASSLVVYLLGLWFTANAVMIFIITILLLAADFYYLKNIAGRRLVGLRWWNEVDPQTGDSHWVFESASTMTVGAGGNLMRTEGGGGGKVVNPTDKRFFWLAIYVQPLLWLALAILAMIRFKVIWLPLVAIALALTITNSLAFSRCDKFSQASNLAGSALSGTSIAGSIASGMMGRVFGRA